MTFRKPRPCAPCNPGQFMHMGECIRGQATNPFQRTCRDCWNCSQGEYKSSICTGSDTYQVASVSYSLHTCQAASVSYRLHTYQAASVSYSLHDESVYAHDSTDTFILPAKDLRLQPLRSVPRGVLSQQALRRQRHHRICAEPHLHRLQDLSKGILPRRLHGCAWIWDVLVVRCHL